MLPTERQLEIMSILNKKKSVTVSQLCTALYSSGATIRRDLAQLEQKGLLCRSHGGAILIEGGSRELSVIARLKEHVQEKSTIAQLASLYVNDGNTLFFDSSSTVSSIVQHLSKFRHLTIITNGLHCALELSQSTNFDVYLPAGKLTPRTNSLVGSDTLKFLENFHADAAIVSCSGISLKAGVTESNVDQSRIKQAMLKNAKTKILLCDKSKFDRIYFSKTCDISYFDYLICEEDPGPEWREFMKNSPCELIVQ